MADWLFKEEPDCYSFDQLEKDGATTWEGVTNALARKNLRQVRKGDHIYFYHTGKVKAIVGIMKAATDAKPDPKDEDAKGVVVKVEPVRRLKQPISLATIKADAALQEWELVRLSRLSVMPVTKAQKKRIEELEADRKPKG